VLFEVAALLQHFGVSTASDVVVRIGLSWLNLLNVGGTV